MAGYAKRKRMIIMKMDNNKVTKVIRMLDDLDVKYTFNTSGYGGDDFYNLLMFEASLPLYEKIKKLVGEDMICFDRV